MPTRPAPYAAPPAPRSPPAVSRTRAGIGTTPSCTTVAWASLATGRYVHQIGYWDNAHPYDGRVRGWGHHLIEAGHRVVSIGKLHYRDVSDPTGLSEQILPLHVVEGIGDAVGLLRATPRARGAAPYLAAEAGPGESTYTDYDRRITAAACDWLRREGSKEPERPWLLFVSLVCPHFPLIAPPEFFDLYPPKHMPLPRLYRRAPTHPVLQALRQSMNYGDYFDEEKNPDRAFRLLRSVL